MYIFFYFFIFIVGVCMGSFLNVLIHRLPQEKTILGRSQCPKCGHQLAWKDLVPIFSFIRLKGRCRYCREKISWQYPLVEITTGLLFLLIFNFQFLFFNQLFNFSIFNLINLIYLLSLTSCLIVIFVSDLKYFIIPDEIIIAGIIFVLIFWIFNLGFISNFEFRISNLKSLLNPLSSGFATSAFFLAIVLITKGKGMGFGDVKLAFFMGLILGWPKIAVALFLAFFIGALIGIGLIIFKKASLKSEIPFGTFLSLATFFILIFGDKILNWYLKFLV